MVRTHTCPYVYRHPGQTEAIYPAGFLDCRSVDQSKRCETNDRLSAELSNPSQLLTSQTGRNVKQH